MYNMMYMARKVRKQLYLEQRQQDRLARLSDLHGVSESELIRQAIDRQLLAADLSIGDGDAWSEAVEFMHKAGRRSAQRRPQKWNREELYEERVGKFAPGSGRY